MELVVFPLLAAGVFLSFLMTTMSHIGAEGWSHSYPNWTGPRVLVLCSRTGILEPPRCGWRVRSPSAAAAEQPTERGLPKAW